MPDDDYGPRAKYYDEETRPEEIRTEEKTKQINALLDFIDRHITKVKEENFEVYAAVKNLTKVLRLMNDIE